MNKQTTKRVEIITPQFTEQAARDSVEKRKGLARLRQPVKWVSSLPLYLPFWLVDVQMDLQAPKHGKVQRTYTIMVNAITNRGMLLKGNLNTTCVETHAIFLEQEVSADQARDTARVEALADTKRLLRPPPHRVMPGQRLVWYPLALVKLRTGDKEEVQVFDYYRGGVDKFTMRFLKLKEKLSQEGAEPSADSGDIEAKERNPL